MVHFDRLNFTNLPLCSGLAIWLERWLRWFHTGWCMFENGELFLPHRKRLVVVDMRLTSRKGPSEDLPPPASSFVIRYSLKESLLFAEISASLTSVIMNWIPFVTAHDILHFPSFAAVEEVKCITFATKLRTLSSLCSLISFHVSEVSLLVLREKCPSVLSSKLFKIAIVRSAK